MPHTHDTDMLLNELIARGWGLVFMVLVVALCVGMIAVGAFGLYKTRGRHHRLA